VVRKARTSGLRASYVNWVPLCFGIGLLLEGHVIRPAWVLVLLVTGMFLAPFRGLKSTTA
jgi:hypothetical protein